MHATCLYVANLSYNFIRTQRAKLGVRVGVHVADLDLKVSGKAKIFGVSVKDRGAVTMARLQSLPS